MGITEAYILPILIDYPLVVVLTIVVLVVTIYLQRNSNNKTAVTQQKGKYSFKSEVLESFGEDEDETDNLVPPLHSPDTKHIEYKRQRYSEDEMEERVNKFYENMNGRRSVRFFSDQPIPESIIKKLILTAGTSPSGAHTEPWTFVAVKDDDIKQEIQNIVESEERINYEKRMGKQWTHDLKALGTDYHKEYLSIAPWLILVFRQSYYPLDNNKRRVHYYNEISTSLSAGILIAAIQNAGLVTLTSTPLNCGPALRTLLERPSHEKLMLLLPIGYPAENATVPNLIRKPVEDIMVVI